MDRANFQDISDAVYHTSIGINMLSNIYFGIFSGVFVSDKKWAHILVFSGTTALSIYISNRFQENIQPGGGG